MTSCECAWRDSRGAEVSALDQPCAVAGAIPGPDEDPAPGLHGARAHDPRPHRRQRLPRLRALADERSPRRGSSRSQGRAGEGNRGHSASSARPESVREVVSQRLSRLDPENHRSCSSSQQSAGPEFELASRSARAAGIARARASSRARARQSGAGMIEEIHTARGLGMPLHPRDRAGGRSMTDSRGCDRAELHLRDGGGVSRAPGSPAQTARLVRPRPSLRRSRSVLGGDRAGGRLQPDAPRPGPASAVAYAFDDAAHATADRKSRSVSRRAS